MKSYNKLAKWTGVGYLLIFITGFYSNFYVIEGLTIPDDLAATLQSFVENVGLLRTGIAGFFIMVIADLLIAWTLYLILEPVDKKLSLLSGWLRLVNAAMFGLALSALLKVLKLVSTGGFSGLLSQEELAAQVGIALADFSFIWLIGLIFFGMHLLVLGYLIFRSGYIHKIIGVLLLIAGAGYLVDSFANFLLADYKSYKDIFMTIVIIPGVVGELSLTLWLLIKGLPGLEDRTN